MPSPIQPAASRPTATEHARAASAAEPSKPGTGFEQIFRTTSQKNAAKTADEPTRKEAAREAREAKAAKGRKADAKRKATGSRDEDEQSEGEEATRVAKGRPAAAGDSPIKTDGEADAEAADAPDEAVVAGGAAKAPTVDPAGAAQAVAAAAVQPQAVVAEVAAEAEPAEGTDAAPKDEAGGTAVKTLMAGDAARGAEAPDDEGGAAAGEEGEQAPPPDVTAKGKVALGHLLGEGLEEADGPALEAPEKPSHGPTSHAPGQPALDAAGVMESVAQQSATAAPDAAPAKGAAETTTLPGAEGLGAASPPAAGPRTGAPAAAPAPPPPPAPDFAEANHARIITGIRGQLLPNGGTMQIRLDPPELGAIQVRIEIRDGVVTAAFETTSDHATKLLGHSLDQLRTALEQQGVNVDKLQVRQQAPSQEQQSARDGDAPRQQQNLTGDDAARQEQQRKDLLNRMWRRLAGGGDPLDLVA